MINIKRKYILCKKHDISHSKESGCKICKLDIDNYDISSKYMQNKIYKQFIKELIKKIKEKFKNHHYKEILKNILNDSNDEKIIKFKNIIDKRKKTKRKKNKNKQNDKVYICKLCGENLNAPIDHFTSEEHINNFNKNIEISTKKSIEEKFVDIIFKFKINTKDAFLKDLYFKEVAKQKARENMIKNKKYKYNITFHKGFKDNITNKLTDYKISYNTEDIFNAIDTTFSDMNILNTTDRNGNPDEEKTKLRQKEIIEKEKERLDAIESMSEQDKDKLFEENKN